MDSERLTFSIIMPAYNGAAYIGKSIESVLAQSYPDFELIIVNDCSPDNTEQVVKEYTDPRIHYIAFEENQGADEARKAGLHASSGDIIAFLDQDDLFHPQKLALHAQLYEQNADVGVTYNARYELNHSSDTIREIWEPPAEVDLADLVIGFPFAPSDMMLRRAWAMREDIWDMSFVHQGEEVIGNGGEIVFCGRLYLAGCKFTGINRALNYRRYYADRHLSDLLERCQAEKTCQDIILFDPRCPQEVKALADKAYTSTYLIWSFFAFTQQEIELGQNLLHMALKLSPDLGKGSPSELVEFFLFNCTACEPPNAETAGHEEMLALIFSHLPLEYSHLDRQRDWAVAQGYLLRGMRSIVWNQGQHAQALFQKARESEAEIDNSFIQKATHQILAFEREMGPEMTETTLAELCGQVEAVAGKKAKGKLHSCVAVNRAFRQYQTGEIQHIPADMVRAIAENPAYIANRGVVSVLVRSYMRTSLYPKFGRSLNGEKSVS